MNYRYTLILFIAFFYLQSYSQTDPIIQRVTVDPSTYFTTVYFSGSDHPDITSYKVWFWPEGLDGSGEIIHASEVAETGESIYASTFEHENVRYEPVGFTIDAFGPNIMGGDSAYFASPTEILDSTIHLSFEYDPCQASVRLWWNDYNTWRGNNHRLSCKYWINIIFRYSILGNW